MTPPTCNDGEHNTQERLESGENLGFDLKLSLQCKLKALGLVLPMNNEWP